MCRSKVRRSLAVALIASLALVACNNDDSGSSGTGGGGDSATRFLLPYFDAGDSGGAIKLVDPDSPAATPLTADSGFGVTDVATGNIDADIISTYDFDASSGAQTKLQPTEVVYAKNGKLYKIDLASDASHAPQQFSSLNTVCALVNEFDDGTLADTYLVVQSLNSSGVCSFEAVPGDTLSLVKLGATTSDAGIAQNGRAIEDKVINGAGKLSGFLVEETASGTVTLRSEDVTLSNPVDLLTLTGGSFFEPAGGPFIAGTGVLEYFTAQADGDSNRGLYRFNPAADAVAMIAALNSPSGGFGSSDTRDYFYVDGGTLNAVAHDSTTPSVLLTRTLATGESLAIDDLSPTRVVFSDTGSTAASLESLPKAGGSAVTIDSATFASPDSTTFQGFGLGTERLFYTREDINTSAGFSLNQTALQAMTDGSGKTTTASNAFWSGIAVEKAGTGKVFLTELGPDNSAHLFAYSPSSGAQQTDIGTASNVDSQAFGPFVYAVSGDKTLFAYSPLGASDNDTYFLDAGADNSLLPIATQAGVNETPIDNF